MIMGRAAVPPGQIGRNGHARAGREGSAALRSSSATVDDPAQIELLGKEVIGRFRS